MASPVSMTPEFPCRHLPDDPAQARRLGLYGQRQEGLLMQRVRIPLGRLLPGQLRGLATLAERFTPATPLRLTTRQDLEFHNLSPADIPALQTGLHDLGLTTVDACGDTVRNLVACPEDGLLPGGWDLAPMAAALARLLAALPEAASLPRKFKISLSCDPAGCARPWLNDLGLVARPDGTLDVMLAGSLGARPALAIAYAQSIAPDAAFRILVAAVQLFHLEGDRQNRHRARLRHVRERLGDDEFRRRLDALRDEAMAAPTPVPAVGPQRVAQAPRRRLRLRPLLGDLPPSLALAIADVAGADGEIRLGLDHDLWVVADNDTWIPPEVAAITDDLARGALVACPGTTWCSRGIADARGLALRIRTAMPPGSPLAIAISGCPNNCAHSAVADIGLVGRMKTVDGLSREHWRLFAGGGRGMSPQLAAEIHPAVPADDAPAIVAALAEEFARDGNGSPFAKFAACRAEHWRRDLAGRIGTPDA